MSMSKPDRLIAQLVDAMDTILRAENLSFCKGVAEQAIENVNRERVRNSDGYLVVKS